MDVSLFPISSLYKIRSLQDLPDDRVRAQTLLLGEHFSFQIVASEPIESDRRPLSRQRHLCHFSASVLDENGVEVPALTDALCLYRIQNVIMDFPVYDDHDDDIITDQPGLMPDLLVALADSGNCVRIGPQMAAILVCFQVPRTARPGSYTLQIEADIQVTSAPDHISRQTVCVDLTVMGRQLPLQSTHFTQWFHVDSIAEAYRLPIYSEGHWMRIGQFMAMARELGIDTILTPVITPPLDTMMGGERPKVQLLKIEKQGDTYSFDFTLLKRFIDLARTNGIENFEISHLFSQWGLIAAPNIYVWENGCEKRLFDWHTPAQSEAYCSFLRQMLPALTDYLEALGVLEHCYFHLSDEPVAAHLANYRAAHDLVKPLLKGRPIMDAISNIDFYQNGLIDIPVTGSNHMEPFLNESIDQQWTYYCCAQYRQVGNRFLAFPAYRNRILGFQLYKYNIRGFLQWGFNFYHAERSVYCIDPYVTTSADGIFPSGDPFSVYPGPNGPLPTLRAVIFREALQDVEILKLLEWKTSHRYVVDMMEQEAGMELTFTQYPRSYRYIPDTISRVKQNLMKIYEGSDLAECGQ